MKIIKWFLNLFKDYSWLDDWELIYSQSGKWNIDVHSDFGDYKDTDHCLFEIYKSKEDEDYKLILSGYQPKNHPMYEHIFKLYRELKEGTLCIRGGEIYKKD